MGKIVLPNPHPFLGISEKLNRSNENICNLESELARFFEASDYPILSHDNQKMIPEALEYHSKRPIPARFSVLSGEIIHHLRSCLDHIVWHFSDSEFRAIEKNARYIEFPILKDPPSPSDVYTRYERKIKGISNAQVRDLIFRLQPHQRPAPDECVMLAIHNMDITDKHRELGLVFSVGSLHIPMELWRNYVDYELGVPGATRPDIAGEFKRHGKIAPEIAFRNFCGAETETVVQALGFLHNHVIEVVKAFDALL